MQMDGANAVRWVHGPGLAHGRTAVAWIGIVGLAVLAMALGIAGIAALPSLTQPFRHETVQLHRPPASGAAVATSQPTARLAALGPGLGQRHGMGVALVPGQGILGSTPAPRDLERQLLAQINADRTQAGRRLLRWDAAAASIARQRARRQLTETPSHFDAHGNAIVVSRLAEAGLPYRTAGENLGLFEPADHGVAERAEQAFLASPTHRAVTLERSFDRVAIGAALDGAGRVAFAAIFRSVPADRTAS